jgi:hypothetical protein
MRSATGNAHFDQACFVAVVGAYGLTWVVASRFLPGFGGCVLFLG